MTEKNKVEQEKEPSSEKVSCDVCLKEIPRSEAKVEEVTDYVAHFCGLECYEKWRQDNNKLNNSCSDTKLKV